MRSKSLSRQLFLERLIIRRVRKLHLFINYHLNPLPTFETLSNHRAKHINEPCSHLGGGDGDIISNIELRSGKNLSDPYKDHPTRKSVIEEETPMIVVKQDISFKDEDEKMRAEPNPHIYKPHIPYH